MSTPSRPRSKKQRNRHQPPATRPADLWRRMPEASAPEPILPTPEPSALIRSLGPPPLQDSDATAQYFAAVIERAATLASALASSAGLLGEDTEQ